MIDLVKNVDEIKTTEDIVTIWRIDGSLAEKIFSLLTDVISLQDTGSCIFEVTEEISDEEADESLDLDDSEDDE